MVSVTHVEGPAYNVIKRPNNFVRLVDHREAYDSRAPLNQKFKSNSKHPIVYFDRPGDYVEGTIWGPYPRGQLHQSCFILDYQGVTFEIVAHKLLRPIIEKNKLSGKYVRITYRGKTRAQVKRAGGALRELRMKSYIVEVAESVRFNQFNRVNSNLPQIEDDGRLDVWA